MVDRPESAFRSLSDSLAGGLVKEDLKRAESQDYVAVPDERESGEALLHVVIDGELIEGDRFACAR